jgi:hypothetical protein
VTLRIEDEAAISQHESPQRIARSTPSLVQLVCSIPAISCGRTQ